MKLNTLLKYSLMFFVFGNILAACKSTEIPNQAVASTPSQMVNQSLSYVSLSDEEKVKASEAIIRGKIITISPTTWNQDNGEVWANENSGVAALQVHTINIQIEQKIVDTLGLNDTLTVTCLGTSPLEEYADYKVGVGDEAVLFVKKAKIAWREGETKEVILYTGSPLQSIYLKQDNGQYAALNDTEVISLDDLITKISSFRGDVLK